MATVFWAGVTLVLVVLSQASLLGQQTSESWQEIAARKRQGVSDKIPAQWVLPPNTISQAREQQDITGSFMEDILDDDTRYITILSVPQLMEMTANGSLSSVKMAEAFCKRAAYGHQLNNNLLEIGFSQAIERAETLDQYRAAYGRTVGPLHGLPMTVKDQFHVKGMETTMGYIGWIDTFEGNKSSPFKLQTESELVRELEALGANIIGKTTVVQSLWFMETNNNILGYHFNPRNQKLSSGGSSGGEGGVQALRGSAIGIGTDIGGSVSMPAAFNGVYSIKPSSGRLSFLNVADSSPGQMNIPTVPGILGPCIASLQYLMQSLLSAEPWKFDADVVNLPWRKPADVKNDTRLAFGFLEFDGFVKPHPPITRALNTVADAVRAAGHEVLPWNPPAHSTAREIHASITGANGYHDVFENLNLSGEPLIPELQQYFPANRALPPDSAIKVEAAVMRLKNYRRQYREYWLSTANETSSGRPIDAVILPVVPSAATIPGKIFYTYITVASVLDYTTLVIPVTRADKDIDKFNSSYTPVNDQDKLTWESYDPVLYHGAPASIQILAGRLEEEKLLAIGEIVADALVKWQSSAVEDHHPLE